MPQSPATLQQLANYLRAGFWEDVDNRNFTSHWFNVSNTGTGANSGVLYYNLTGTGGTRTSDYGTSFNDADGIDPARRDLVRAAFDVYEAVLGIDFRLTTSTSTAVDLFFTDELDGNFAQQRTYSGTGGAVDFGVVNVAGTSNAVVGSGLFLTYLHEIGHILGLGHQGDYDGSGSYSTAANWENDSWQLSLMSYWSQSANTDVDASFARPMTPMAADLLALDDLYSRQDYAGRDFGVETAFTGNTRWAFNSDIPDAVSEAYSSIDIRAGINAFTIVDGGGTDLVDFVGLTDDLVIDLAPSNRLLTQATTSNIGGLRGNMTLAVGTIIENVRGGSGDDLIHGNDYANDIYGGWGSDTMFGELGNDDFYYRNAMDGQYDMLNGGPGHDRMILHGNGLFDMRNINAYSIEEIEFINDGTDIDKTLRLSNHDLRYPTSFARNLVIDGNNVAGSNDRVDIYLNSGPDLDISDWQFVDWSDTMDSLYIYARSNGDENNVVGSARNDIMYLRGGDDVAWGESRSDEIHGQQGNDVIRGGTGADVLFGDDGEDRIYGGDGADIVRGGDDNDTLIGNDDGDTLFGGEGDDYINGSYGNDMIYAGRDNDRVYGGANDDFLYGDLGDDMLRGGTGDDVLNGNAGQDNLAGGSGDDALWGNDQADTFMMLQGMDIERIQDFEHGIDRIDVLAHEMSWAEIAASTTPVLVTLPSNDPPAVQIHFDGVFQGGDRAIVADTVMPGTFGRSNALDAGDFSNLVIGEFGTISLNDAGRTLSFSHDYQNPVVIAQCLSYNGVQPAAARITDVTSGGFSLFVEEPEYLDGSHATESLSYMVVEAGRWELADGRVLEAGIQSTDRLVHDGFEALSFSGSFAQAPSVFTQVQSHNGHNFVVTRQTGTTNEGFRFAMQEKGPNGGTHAVENVGWIAFENGRGISDGEPYEVATTSSSFDGSFDTLTFARPFGNRPGFVTSMATTNGADPAMLRWTNATTASVDLMVQEEQSVDAEVSHVNEAVSYFAFEDPGVLYGSFLVA
ncbi:M10 family metallopeptidase C-terminal domain-containing protein [Poseidonocella sp. HB161398]|uniref:M10 family metallopeptidase C-terminal domain-containing protein n=1 Tax=Poseidonocella sp. HB161398 TaxID=2320855 RepID=UPI0011086261|nr:M10 family metallopeptidase C-terminal domain-containing protein [Poseidonocella sp. HB161398]